MFWLRDIDSEFFYVGIDALVYCWNERLHKHGDYIEN